MSVQTPTTGPSGEHRARVAVLPDLAWPEKHQPGWWWCPCGEWWHDREQDGDPDDIAWDAETVCGTCYEEMTRWTGPLPEADTSVTEREALLALASRLEECEASTIPDGDLRAAAAFIRKRAA